MLDGKERQDELHASLTVVEGNLRARVDTAEERMRAAEARALEMEEEAEDLARALMAERKNRGFSVSCTGCLTDSQLLQGLRNLMRSRRRRESRSGEY